MCERSFIYAYTTFSRLAKSPRTSPASVTTQVCHPPQLTDTAGPIPSCPPAPGLVEEGASAESLPLLPPPPPLLLPFFSAALLLLPLLLLLMLVVVPSASTSFGRSCASVNLSASNVCLFVLFCKYVSIGGYAKRTTNHPHPLSPTPRRMHIY